MILEDGLYDAIVITNEIDPTASGGVRAKILGYTDTYKDNEQPFVYPELINGQQSVPLKGYYLKVKFLHGNINMGRYVAVSQSANYLPKEYVSQYPYISYTNLGTDGYYMIYNRNTNITNIVNNITEYNITVDQNGMSVYDSDKAYSNAGYGANNNTGIKNHPILTEATIDIFTAMPVGNNKANGGLNQGTEYASISHVSQATIDAFNGTLTADKDTTQISASDPISDSDVETNAIYDSNGTLVENIQYHNTENYIKRTGKKAKFIFISITNGVSFPETSAKIVENNSKFSCHYLVGRVEGDPEIISTSTQIKNSGFVQFVDITNDSYYGNNTTVTLNKNKKTNIDSIVILLVASNDLSNKTMGGYTNYQYTKIKELVEHIRYKVGDNIPIVINDDTTGIPSLVSMSNFDKSQVL